MAVTAALASSRANSLRYLVTSDAMGGTLTIPNDGGVTPDLKTDSVGGQIKQMVLARLNGYGAIAAGALTQANARSIFMGDGASAGNSNIPRAETTVTPRTGTAVWSVDANVDGDGDPVIAVTATAAVGTAYLDITVPNMIGAGN